MTNPQNTRPPARSTAPPTGPLPAHLQRAGASWPTGYTPARISGPGRGAGEPHVALDRRDRGRRPSDQVTVQLPTAARDRRQFAAGPIRGRR